MTRPFEPTEAQLPEVLRGSWHRFLDTYEPLRAELYRYCRHLTRSPWDAEDLAQDALARAFVTLGQMGVAPDNPRAWLFRVASNLWIDRARRQRLEAQRATHAEPVTAASHGAAPLEVRAAAGPLFDRLSPHERAAVVLKDVFELSLDEVAIALSTTVATVKSALHRGRAKLSREADEAPSRTPPPAVIDAFCAAFNAADLDRLTALLLDTSVVDVVGASTEFGPEAARKTVLWGMLFGTRIMANADTLGGMEPRFVQGVLDVAPRAQAREHRGEWLLLHWYRHSDGEFVRAITRVEAEGDRLAKVHNYFFTPDFIADVCGELDVPWRSNGNRWWLRFGGERC